MPLNLKNLEFFKNLTQWTPEAGTRLAELVTQISEGVSNIEAQGNFNATGAPPAPPSINSLHVTAQNGHFQIGINHEGANFYRGVQYFVDHADNPQFTNAQTIDLGTTRNHSIFLGNVTRFWRAYAAYPSSPPGPHVYFGSSATPKSVTGGGAIGGPAFTQGQSSGTGRTGQSGQGPGLIPFRTATGGPPVR